MEDTAAFIFHEFFDVIVLAEMEGAIESGFEFVVLLGVQNCRNKGRKKLDDLDDCERGRPLFLEHITEQIPAVRERWEAELRSE